MHLQKLSNESRKLCRQKLGRVKKLHRFRPDFVARFLVHNTDIDGATSSPVKARHFGAIHAQVCVWESSGTNPNVGHSVFLRM
jgi:hypothetical protein